MALAYWHALSTTNSEISNVVYYIFTAGDRDVTTHTNLGGPEVSAASDISDSVSWDVKAGLNAEYKDRLGLGISAGFGGSEHTDSEARVSLGVRFEF